MIVEAVKEKVALIAAKADCPERAHYAEDNLYEEVMTAIAEGATNAQDLAVAALKTKVLDFERWYE